MWILTQIDINQQFFIFKEGTLTIGRKEGCDIPLKYSSVSRLHAELVLKRDSSGDQLFVRDLSKFGTLLNNQKLKPQEEKELVDGSILHFGLVQFQVTKDDLILTTSGSINKAKKASLQTLLEKIGGRLVEEAEEAGFMLTEKLKLSKRLLLFLQLEKVVVSPSWLLPLTSAPSFLLALPSPQEHVPSTELPKPLIGDQDLGNLLKPNPLRKNLFENTVFLFCSSIQYDRTSQLLELGKGEALLIEERKRIQSIPQDKAEVFLVNLLPAAVPSAQDPINIFNAIIEAFEGMERSYCLVDEEDIGMAILEASRSNYCKWSNTAKPQKKRKLNSQKFSLGLPKLEEKHSSSQKEREKMNDGIEKGKDNKKRKIEKDMYEENDLFQEISNMGFGISDGEKKKEKEDNEMEKEKLKEKEKQKEKEKEIEKEKLKEKEKQKHMEIEKEKERDTPKMASQQRTLVSPSEPALSGVNSRPLRNFKVFQKGVIQKAPAHCIVKCEVAGSSQQKTNEEWYRTDEQLHEKVKKKAAMEASDFAPAKLQVKDLNSLLRGKR